MGSIAFVSAISNGISAYNYFYYKYFHIPRLVTLVTTEFNDFVTAAQENSRFVLVVPSDMMKVHPSEIQPIQIGPTIF